MPACGRGVEQLITVPLERRSTDPGLFLMRSTSTFGLSLITVLFRDGYEDYWVASASWSASARPPCRRGGAVARSGRRAGGEIYRYTVESDTNELQELSEISAGS